MVSVRLYCNNYLNRSFEVVRWLVDPTFMTVHRAGCGFYQYYDFKVTLKGTKKDFKWLLDVDIYLDSFSLYQDTGEDLWEILDQRILNRKIHRQSVSIRGNIISLSLTLQYREYTMYMNGIKTDWKLIGF